MRKAWGVTPFKAPRKLPGSETAQRENGNQAPPTTEEGTLT